MMDFAMPFQLFVHAAQIIAQSVDFAADAIAAIAAVVQLMLDVLEATANALEFVTRPVAAVIVGFVTQVAIPFPEAVDIGLIVVASTVVVMVTGLDDRSQGKETGGNSEGDDCAFHRG